MNILITGSNGFIGSNLIQSLLPFENIKILRFCRDTPIDLLHELIFSSDKIVHLAGVNRPLDSSQFELSNTQLTAKLCKFIELTGKKIPVIFSSTTHVKADSPYGISKLKCEDLLKNTASKLQSSLTILRLPGVYGKWCKPDYNNVVGTFCHNIAHDLPIDIHDHHKHIELIYIDNLVDSIIDSLFQSPSGAIYKHISPVYSLTVGDLAHELYQFKKLDGTNLIPDLSTPLRKTLYSTYLSYMPISKSTYTLTDRSDSRGKFVEVFKHPNAGQISYLSAKPGVTRGGHFHNSKVEKFLVIRGSARFRFLNVSTHEKYEITTTEEIPQIVQTLPGWAHDITNIGEEEMMAIVWSNEIFDSNHPDTIKSDIL